MFFSNSQRTPPCVLRSAPSIPIKTHFASITICLDLANVNPNSCYMNMIILFMHNFWVSILQGQQQLEDKGRVPRPPQYNTRKWKSNENREGLWHLAIMWMMSGGCDVNVEGVVPDYKYVHNKVVCYRSSKITRYRVNVWGLAYIIECMQSPPRPPPPPPPPPSPPPLPLASTMHPPDVIYMVSVPRPSHFFATDPFLCIILNVNQRTKAGEV